MPVLNPTISRTGAIELFSGVTPPPGTLRANGAAVSRSVYAKLFNVIGTRYGAGDGVNTFTLPDLRGHFPRFFDDGKGVDAGRALGSHQAGQNASHTHTEGWAGDHAHTLTVPYAWGVRNMDNLTAAGYGSDNGMSAPATSTAGGHVHAISASGGNEARPTNIALMGCIVYE